MRHALHQQPELSGAEKLTALTLASRLREYGAEVTEGLAGHGVLGVFDSGRSGPSLLLRAELDALPIDESIALPYASRTPGVSHKCGHDGHMAIMDGVAAQLAERELARGRVGILFQPAEETGAGAAAILEDARWTFDFDAAYALHNLPGARAGSILCRPGIAALASRGLEARWLGREAHAAHPEAGISPMRACIASTLAWSERAAHPPGFDYEKITVVHAGVGQPSAFGTAPGEARLQATLRSGRESDLDSIENELRASAVTEPELRLSFQVCDPFPECINAAAAFERVRRVCTAHELELEVPDHPFSWSEDFGHFLRRAPGALFGLGAGLEQPQLHDPAYDFPDAILPVGIQVFLALVESHLQDDDSARS